MTGCKGTHPGDAAVLVPTGTQLMQQQQEKLSLDVSRNMSSAVTSQETETVASSRQDIDVDLREVYFLVMHFLANGPCTRAFGQLWNELLQHRLLPRRYHALHSREGEPTADENDDGLSFPLSYRDVASRYPGISNSHLVDLLQQLLVSNSRSVSALDSLSKTVTAADTPTLLGWGAFSLLDLERSRHKVVVSRWNQHMRWPHWQADQVHGLTLRELGGGFARHNRAPSVRTASYVIAKPSVFFHRIQIIKKLRGHRNAVYCAIFDRNGQHVITGSDDRLVKIWSTETGLCLRSCRGHEGDITDLAVDSSNELVASASNDFSIRVWNLPDGFPVSVLRGHGGAVTAIAFSPRQGCEHHLLSSSDDGTCRIWDARDSTVNSRVYMPDPKDSQNAVRGVTPQVPPGPPVGNQILCCSFNADGSIFVTGSSDKIARVWNATKWNDEHSGRPNYEMDMLQGHENDVNYVQFSGCAAPTRPLLAENSKEENQPRFKNTWSAHDSIVTCSRDGSAIIWTPRPRRHHAKAGRWVKAYHLRVPAPPNPPQPPRPGGPRQRLLPIARGVNMIVWSLDNRFVLAAIMDCRICVWNAVDGSLVHSLTGHSKQTYVLDVHPFNPRIAMSAGYDGRVIIWDIWDGHPIRIYETGDYYLVDGKFSPDGASLVVSDEVGQIYLFATGEGNSQKDAKYDQFFLGDFRPLVRDTHGNVLDQETQLPPHQRNIQDLLCDASMIPYAEPYQTIYQQRRLGALGIDWQPPTVFLQVGTLDDPTYTGPPDPPVPIQAAVLPTPVRPERRALASDGGNRWVEQPNEGDEVMDWEQEVAGLTEDSGSDYSASEESEDDGEDKGDSLAETDSEEEEEDEEDDERIRDISCLRRSSRNKRKAEVPKFSSSGRRVKRRKRYDEGDTQGSGRRLLRRRKGKVSRKPSPSKRPSPSRRARHSGRRRPEPLKRPKRQAARNALNFFSSINDDEEEEAVPQAGKKVVDHSEKASGPGEQSHRVLRSRHREEADDPPNELPTLSSKVESSDRGELSRRPRSQRKLVLKLRSSSRKVDLEDSKPEDPHAQIPADDQAVKSGRDPVEDKAGSSENAVTTEVPSRPLRKLVIKHPKPSGLKRHALVIESSEDNHYDCRIGKGNHSHSRRLGPTLHSDEEAYDRNIPLQEQIKGKAPKRSKGIGYPEYHGDGSGSSKSGSSNHVEEDWRDDVGPSGNVKSSGNVNVDVKDMGEECLEKENKVECSTDVVPCEAKQASFVEVGMVASNGESSWHFAVEDVDEPVSEWHDIPCHAEAPKRRISPETFSGDGVFSATGDVADLRVENGESKEKSVVENNDVGLARTVSQGLEVQQNVPDADLAVETLSQIRVGESVQGAQIMDHETPDGSGSERYVSAEEDCVGDLERSERPISSQCSDDAVKDSLINVEDQPHMPGDPTLESDRDTELLEEETDNDLDIRSISLGDTIPVDSGHDTDLLEDDLGKEGEEGVGESMQQTESVEQESQDDNSQSELFEGIEESGRNWDESRHQQTEDESFDEQNHNSRCTRQRAVLEESQIHGRQETTSNSQEVNLDEPSAKPRVRQLNSVVCEGQIETRLRTGKLRAVAKEPIEILERRTRTRTKDVQDPQQGGAGESALQIRRGRFQDLPSRIGASDPRRGQATQGSTSDREGQKGSVEFEKKRVVSLKQLKDDNRPLPTRERRTSSRYRQEQLVDNERGKVFEESTGLHGKDSKGKKKRRKPGDRDMSWLLLTEVEAGTRYIPQFGDDVVYLRQGHEEFLELSHMFDEKGPWRTLRCRVCAVEFCRITALKYFIVQQSGQTCCKLSLKFTEKSNKTYGKSFDLTLPELTDFPDFIVERSRYDGAMKKGWAARDKCQVWWRSDDEVGGGKWWDGRVKKVQTKSSEYPDSPWDRLFVQYKLDTNEPTSHSPWELFEPGNHWHDPPHIDDESKAQLLSAIAELEKSCCVGNEDEFGLRCLSQDVENPDYVNWTPLPLDVDIVKQRLEKDYYHSLEAFRHDIELLVLNAEVYHGRGSGMVAKMQKLDQVLLEAMSYDEAGSSDGEGPED